MKPLVENELTLTRELYYQGMSCVGNFKKIVRNTLLLIAGLWIVMSLFSMMMGGGPAWGYLIPMGLVGVYILVIYPRGRWKKGFKSMQESACGDMARKTTFTRNGFTVKSAMGEREFTYPEVKELRETRDLIVLICEDKVGVILAKDGFTLGSAEDVGKLVRNDWQDWA